MHRVAVYFLDYDNLGRTGTILRIFRASIGGMSDITQGAAPCVEDMVNQSCG